MPSTGRRWRPSPRWCAGSSRKRPLPRRGPEAVFTGWPPAALDFYRDLEQDNSRAFFTAHKDVYERDVRAPFEALGELVAEEFGPLKVFRPNRDVRFSKDKSPYK